MSQKYFKQAELALATYANLEIGVDVKDELKIAGFSAIQADAFIQNYRVISQLNDAATGLSATVFADADNNTYLAIRGTEASDIRDLATGVFDIMLFGSTKLHPQYNSLKVKVTEWLGNGTLPASFTVTGHSMGGFLAVGLVDDPAFADHVSHAYLYNAPGSGGVVGPVLAWMGLASVYDQSKISSIVASAGPSPIAGLGFDVAPPIDITIEDQIAPDISNPPYALNHSQQVLTDALAIYSAYSQLASSLSQDQLNTLIDAFGSTKDIAGASNSETLESALDALRTILQNPAGGKIVLDGGKETAVGDRDAFYANLKNLQSTANLTSLANTTQLTLLTDKSASNIVAMAANDGAQGLATRFALVALNPFVLEGVDYSAFNAGGALERFDFDTGTRMTAEWRLAA